MLVPTDVPVDVPVTLTVVGPPLRVVAARLVRLSAGEMLLADPEFRPGDGARVIVTLDERTRLSGRVLPSEASAPLRVSREAGRLVDDRAAPRVTAPVTVRYRPLPEGRTTDPRWLAGGPDEGAFRTFRGLAQLSVSGMLLEGETSVPVGRHLALELVLDGRALRVVACVRRLQASKGASGSGVEFVEIGDDEAEALSAFTLRHLGAAPTASD